MRGWGEYQAFMPDMLSCLHFVQAKPSASACVRTREETFLRIRDQFGQGRALCLGEG